MIGKETRYTVTIVGSHGFMGLVGYDWAPLGVDLATKVNPELTRSATDSKGYIWQLGAALAAECLATGRDLRVAPEHALHVLEIITAARQSQEEGRRIAMTSTFKSQEVPRDRVVDVLNVQGLVVSVEIVHIVAEGIRLEYARQPTYG